MLISNLLTHTDVARRQKTFILEESLPVTFYFKEEFHRFWTCIRNVTNTTKTVLKALQVLDFHLILVNKLTGCPIRGLILDINDNQMPSTLQSPHPPYGSARMRKDTHERLWMLLQSIAKIVTCLTMMPAWQEVLLSK